MVINMDQVIEIKTKKEVHQIVSKQQKEDVYKKVDLSYKDNALRVTYDIESTPDLFTLAMIHNDAFGLSFFISLSVSSFLANNFI